MADIVMEMGFGEEKEKVDFGPELEATLPAASADAQAGRLVEALDALLALEKRTRIANDAFASARVAQAVVRACWAAKDLNGVIEQVSALCKKRGQSKRSTVALVRQALRFVDALREEGSTALPTAVEKPSEPLEAKPEEGEEESKSSSSSSASSGSGSAAAQASAAGAGGKPKEDEEPADPTEARLAREAKQEKMEDASAVAHERDSDETAPVSSAEGAAVAEAAGKTMREARLALITSLREVTDGKIWVEVERARLTRALAEIHEAEGRPAQACTTLQDAAVETYAAMRTGEKLDFLLEQVRLCRDVGDWVRMSIIANKVQRRVIDRLEHQSRKLRHFELLACLHEQRSDALALADDFQAVLECPVVAADEARCAETLGRVAVYTALAPWTETLTARWHAILQDKRIERLPAHQALLRDLVSGEMALLPRPELAPLAADPVFKGLPDGAEKLSAPEAISTLASRHPTAPSAAPSSSSTSAQSASDGSSSSSSSSSSSQAAAAAPGRAPAVPQGARWWGVLHRRVAQHNLRVAARTFSRIKFDRLCELTALTPAVCEEELRDLVTAKDLWARVDRPAGVVLFRRRQKPAQVLTSWGADLSRVLALVERTTHLIRKERMVLASSGRA
ncbi:hypothetical protein FNF27_06319 [Cafeteria roenbergensis]|uniref:PCI domain-containing protein n=1 Tax=Cafeteria roenbergensis TaxID=33653 RepID=A0A5A8E1R6_CAFRO|nr:hypothetical protein FNF27_06319 [Cafeteria roenbergensis]